MEYYQKANQREYNSQNSIWTTILNNISSFSLVSVFNPLKS